MKKDVEELKAEISELRGRWDALDHSDFRRGQIYEVIDEREGDLQRLDPVAFAELRAELGIGV